MDESSEPRIARWSVVWHGYVRERTDGEITREEGAGCRLEVYDDGVWMICGSGGCEPVAQDDPVRFERIVLVLLGNPPEDP